MARETIPGIWANAAAPANINTDAEVATKLAAGWVAEKPSFRVFNWFWKKVTGLLQAIERFGILEWDALTVYPLYGLTMNPSTGIVYKSKQANNLNHAVTDTAWWEVAIVSKAYVDGTFLKAVNGYQILPSGIIMQWGTYNNPGAHTTITFPLAFTTLYSFAISDENGSSYLNSINTRFSPEVSTVNTTGFKHLHVYDAATVGKYHWQAWGV